MLAAAAALAGVACSGLGCSDQASVAPSALSDDGRWVGVAPAQLVAPAEYEWRKGQRTDPVRATNHAQEYAIEIDGGRLRLSAGPAVTPWSLTMEWTGVGRGDELEPVPAVSSPVEVSGNRLAFARGGGLEEWYLNGPLGLEQGFVLTEPPGGRSGGHAATIELRWTGDFATQTSSDQRGVALSGPEGSPGLRYAGLTVVDATGAELRAWMEARGDAIRVRLDDSAARYPVVVDPLFDAQEMLLASSGVASDVFGEAVAASGGAIVVGARAHDAGGGIRSGAAFFYAKSGTHWAEQQTITADDAAPDHRLGCAVAMADEALVVGARNADGVVAGAGAAYVFTRTGTTWTQQQKLVASDGGMADLFGFSVALSGDRIVVGAPEHDDAGTQTGAAYVFARDGTDWTQEQRLTPPLQRVGDLFGYAVAVDGDTVVVGARQDGQQEDFEGSAYVFVRSASTWPLQQEIKASDGAVGDSFGVAVALRGALAVIGAHHRNEPDFNAGVAYVFARSADAWSEQQKLLPSTPVALSRFGAAVALSEAHILVSAPESYTGSTPGAVYAFSRNGTTWVEQRKLEAVAGASGDAFGTAIALTESFAVIGAPGDDDQGELSGSAHVFFGDEAPGAPCESGAECASGYCVDGVCCTTECGGDDPDDCQSCSVATGATADGTCALLDGTDCEDGEFCNGPETCVNGTCEEDDRNACPGPDDDQDCFESCNELTRTCTEYDQDGAACSGGTCQDGTCMLSDGTPCTDDAQCRSGMCTGEVCCRERDCGVYRCGPNGVCLEACAWNLDCAPGYQCYADRSCGPEISEPIVVEGCGCRVPGRPPLGRHGWWLLALTVGGSAVRRCRGARGSACRRGSPTG